MISWILSRFFDFIDIFLQEKKVISASGLEEYFIDNTEHYHTELPECHLDKIYIATHYTPACKQIIEAFKYRSRKNLSLELIPYYNHLFHRFCQIQAGDIIIGVPMFFLHTLKRGYNQSFLLAKGFAEAVRLPFLPLVKKTRYTKHQALLHREWRLTNLKDAFVVDSRYSGVTGSRVIIIDDVISTGSTANEIARVLKQAGAKEIIGLFLASQKTGK